eukprot:gene1389-1856_t
MEIVPRVDNETIIEENKELLVFQGAEAKIYFCTYKGESAVVKERLSKRYRIPELDVKINKQRILQESRCMEKCKKGGIVAPVLLHTDIAHNRLYMERIMGLTIKEFLLQNSVDNYVSCNAIVEKVGVAIGKMHDAEIVHGDLTTSNIMIRRKETNADGLAQSDWEVVLIDFGLGSMKPSVEDKAVDLYVLERAFLSTHPGSESLMSVLLEAYRFGCRK